MFSIRKIFVTTIALVSFFFVTAAFAADYRPVLVDNKLIGSFEGEKWIPGPGEVYVDGKTVNLHGVEENEELFTKLPKATEVGGLPCEASMVKKGQKFAYYSPDGREGEAVVTGTSLYYEGDATGAAGFSIDMDGFDINEADWPNLFIGVLDGIDAAPAPTVRKQGKSLVFSCEYKEEKYSVEWRRGEDDGFKGKLSVGIRSWDIKEEDEDKPVLKPYANEEEMFCGFFDLNGDGALELVVYDSGPNGNVSFFWIDAETGPIMFAWDYMGND